MNEGAEHWTELVELYEYKVADMTAGHVPRGGRQSLGALRELLLAAELPAGLGRRFQVADRTYRQWRSQERQSRVSAPPPPGTRQNPTPPRLSTQSSEDSLPPLSGPDLDAWQALHQMAWHADITARLQLVTRGLRQEAGRPTLRVLYAVAENAERQLRGVTTRFAVPSANDPLVSLGDKDVVAHITQGFTDLLLSAEGRQAVVHQLGLMQDNPFPPHPDEETLREELEAAEREPLAPQAREALIRALRQRYPQTHDPRERPAVREAARRLAQLVEPLLLALPTAPGGRAQVLYGQNLASATPEPDPHARELLVYLGGEVQDTEWQGLAIRWQQIGKNWQVQIGKQMLILYPHLGPAERQLSATEGGVTLQVFYEGSYMLLCRQGEVLAPLGPLAAQARAAALLLDPAEAYANLRLARAAAQVLRGSALNVAAVGPDSAERFRQASPDDLQQFVRQGLSTLLSRIREVEPEQVRRAVEECAALLGLSPTRVDRFHETLHNALHSPETVASSVGAAVPAGPLTLQTSGVFQSYPLGAEPLNVAVGSRLLTLRRNYRGELVALLPGLPAVAVQDFRVTRLNDLSLLMVHQGDWVALAAVPHAPEGEERVNLEWQQ